MDLNLQCVTVEGTPDAMGEALGEALGPMIRQLVDHRLGVARVYLEERGQTGGLDGYREAAGACLARLEAWDTEGHDELRATARAAGVPLRDLYAVANLTDVRDVACLGDEVVGEDEGCTAFISPSAPNRPLIAAQTWDLNAGDVEFVVGVHRLPACGPETWSVTVAGAPTLIGMNEFGVWVGTTNLKVRGAGPGVGYLDILHRAIREPDAQRAAEVAITAPRAAAHSYWMADPSSGVSLECSRKRVIRRDLSDSVLIQTNHCLDPRHRAEEGEVASASSCQRLARAETLLAGGVETPEQARAVLADRTDEALSINRYPEDGEPTTTNACLIGVPSTRRLEACRGPADRGHWRVMAFERTPADH